MDVLSLPATEAAVSRYLEDLWVPYMRELEATVGGFALADDVDLVASETEYQLDRLESENCRAWVAVDGSRDEADFSDLDGDFVGFVVTKIDESPDAFDRPDQLLICEIYVREAYRGTGLAHELVDRAEIWARENDCTEFKLEVDVDNRRAITFYEKLGFEPSRYTMVADVDE